jgi:hypothetical protein
LLELALVVDAGNLAHRQPCGPQIRAVAGVPSEILELRGGQCGVASKPALARFEELLRPGVIDALGDAFAPAKLAIGVSPL